MSRGLRWFLTFLVLVAISLLGLGWFLGSNVLVFAFHEQRATAPVVMVNLLEFHDAEAEQRYRDGYVRETRAMIEELGGRSLWDAHTDDMLAGNAADGWPVITLVEYPSRASFIDLVTSSEHRSRLDVREQALARTAVLAGTPRFPFDPEPNLTYVVRLTQLGEGGSYEDFEDQWGQQEHQILERHAGQLAWSADLNPLTGSEQDRFDRITIISFDDVAAATAWGLDAERETLVSLERRLLARDVVLRMR